MLYDEGVYNENSFLRKLSEASKQLWCMYRNRKPRKYQTLIPKVPLNFGCVNILWRLESQTQLSVRSSKPIKVTRIA